MNFGIVFDIDGVLWHSLHPLAGASDALKRVRDKV